jgi:hypothetical protein
MQSPRQPRRFLAFASALLPILALLPTGRSSADSSAGAISLTFGPSARGEAMGGLFVTEANDYAARWSNPGGLAFIDKGIAGTMFSQLVPGLADDVYYMFLGGVVPTKSIGTLQFDVTYLSYGKSQAVSEDQQNLGEFSSYELSPAASLGFRFLPNLGLGVTVKYVRIDLAPENLLQDTPGSGSGTGSSWAFDLGALYRTDRLRIGGAVTNLGPEITFIDAEQSDPLPRTLRVGTMYDFYRSEVGEVRGGVEIEQSMVTWSRSPVYHAGAEFVYARSFAVRGGYLNDEDGAVKGFAGGFGFTWSRATFEYANVPQADTLDRPHRFALWLRL